MSGYKAWKDIQDLNIRIFKSLVRLVSHREYSDKQKEELLDDFRKAADKLDRLLDGDGS